MCLTYHRINGLASSFLFKQAIDLGIFSDTLLPITCAIRGIQLAVFREHSLYHLSAELVPLLVFTALLLPLSLRAFEYALKKARTDGCMTHF